MIVCVMFCFNFLACGANCATCDGTSSCLSCSAGYYLYGSQCLGKSDEKYFTLSDTLFTSEQ